MFWEAWYIRSLQFEMLGLVPVLSPFRLTHHAWLFKRLVVLCVSILPACMDVCHVLDLCLWKSEPLELGFQVVMSHHVFARN